MSSNVTGVGGGAAGAVDTALTLFLFEPEPEGRAEGALVELIVIQDVVVRGSGV